jgi:hypothetical protein
MFKKKARKSGSSYSFVFFVAVFFSVTFFSAVGFLVSFFSAFGLDAAFSEATFSFFTGFSFFASNYNWFIRFSLSRITIRAHYSFPFCRFFISFTHLKSIYCTKLTFF